MVVTRKVGGQSHVKSSSMYRTVMDTKPHELCRTSVDGEDPRNTNDEGHQKSKCRILSRGNPVVGSSLCVLMYLLDVEGDEMGSSTDTGSD